MLAFIEAHPVLLTNSPPFTFRGLGSPNLNSKHQPACFHDAPFPLCPGFVLHQCRGARLIYLQKQSNIKGMGSIGPDEEALSCFN